MKVKVHPSLCTGWGQCHHWAPDVYPLDEEGHNALHVMAVPPELAEQAYLGARSCPYHAISYDGPVPDRWK